MFHRHHHRPCRHGRRCGTKYSHQRHTTLTYIVMIKRYIRIMNTSTIVAIIVFSIRRPIRYPGKMLPPIKVTHDLDRCRIWFHQHYHRPCRQGRRFSKTTPTLHYLNVYPDHEYIQHCSHYHITSPPLIPLPSQSSLLTLSLSFPTFSE